MLRQLRQGRYLALGALMLVVAAVCIAAGSWQIARLTEKHDANDRLRANAHLPTAAVQDVLVPLRDDGAIKSGERSQFRHVTATGSYLDAQQLLVRERTVDGTVGYLVLTPFRTEQASVLLVVRGFVAADGPNLPSVTAAPTGTVTVTARVQPTEQRPDRYRSGPVDQVRYLNIASIAGRLDVPGGADAIYGGYGELLADAPGTTGLTTIPDPDLSNPAGGAIEPQHVAYVIQWYLFAMLALAAPFVMAWVDSRRGDEPIHRSEVSAALDDAEAAAPPDRETVAHLTRMADRYGNSRRL